MKNVPKRSKTSIGIKSIRAWNEVQMKNCYSLFFVSCIWTWVRWSRTIGHTERTSTWVFPAADSQNERLAFWNFLFRVDVEVTIVIVLNSLKWNIYSQIFFGIFAWNASMHRPIKLFFLYWRRTRIPPISGDIFELQRLFEVILNTKKWRYVHKIDGLEMDNKMAPRKALAKVNISFYCN